MGKKAGKKNVSKKQIRTVKEQKDKTKKQIPPKKTKKLKNKKTKKKSDDSKNKVTNNLQNSHQSKINKEKTAVTYGEIELDQAVEDVNRYIIVPAKPSEYSDKYYAVTLNYTNEQNNNNKFYIIQLLQDIYTKKYGVLYRWVRIGFLAK
jgi:hypothetical protein